ncbi:MAG: sigma-54 dependent transcriptional regulator, partial [Bacteroidota bacterium]
MQYDNTSILVIDDNIELLEAARVLLKRYFGQVEVKSDPRLLPHLLRSEYYDVILLDMNFTGDNSSGKEGFVWLRKIVNINPTINVILITAYGDVPMAVKALKMGATDFLLKPWRNGDLVEKIKETLRVREIRKLEINKRDLQHFEDLKFKGIVGKSPAMQIVLDTIKRVAPTDANVLITGENGTGKDLIARSIHSNSKRKSGPFVPVDVGALTDGLYESELFGYTKGAFTDAKKDHVGQFRMANQGTLFLDEIGNIRPIHQVKLLTVLQSRKVKPIGSGVSYPINIRLVSATNMPLPQMILTQEFRQDLYYRLNTIEIRVPALR